MSGAQARALLADLDAWKARLGGRVHDRVAAAIYAEAQRITGAAASRSGPARNLTARLDAWLTSSWLGVPVMLALLALVFWITIAGANVPSTLLARGLFWLEDRLVAGLDLMHSPWWLTGFLARGVYRGVSWVVSVMLPPMAIFFPLFTLLEDLGYLPRVALNLDRFFRAAGAHGKQALTMSMGFGCNAAGVVACRIIDSPRERLVAILTNNFVPCNGRWPTLILLSTIFVAAGLPAALGALASVGTLLGVTLLGVGVTLLASAALTRTLLRGEASFFALELPPYRRPQILRVLYTSLIDRTAFVLWRAVLMAAPAGGVCWLLGNVNAGGRSLMAWGSGWLDPLGQAIGLNGVILLAYIVAIPANEIVVPTIAMAYLNAGHMVEVENLQQLSALLRGNGWTLLTAICLMLFSLLHYPCSTTTLTIWKETRSLKWTALSNLLPLGVALLACFAVASVARLLGLA